MAVVVELDQQRTKTRFWFPGRVAKVKQNLSRDEFKGRADPLSLGASEDLTSFDLRSHESDTSAETTVVGESSTTDGSERERVTVNAERKRRCFPPSFVSEADRPVQQVAPILMHFPQRRFLANFGSNWRHLDDSSNPRRASLHCARRSYQLLSGCRQSVLPQPGFITNIKGSGH